MNYSQPMGAARDLPQHHSTPMSTTPRRRPALTPEQREEQEVRRLRDILLGYEPGTYADRRRAFEQLKEMGVQI